MAQLRTVRQERFAQARARGLSLAASARDAGYAQRSCHVRGSELGRNAEVQSRVAELREQIDGGIVEAVVADRRWVMQSLIAIAEEAKVARDRSSATRALELVGKELGMFVQKTQDIGSPLDALSVEELQAIARLGLLEDGPLALKQLELSPPNSHGREVDLG